MKIAVFIQSRLNSSRLPGKALLQLSDTTILGMLIKRSYELGYPTYLLTSQNKFDDLIAKEALENGARDVLRGDLFDVRSRFLELSKKIGNKYIARVTGDNPLTILKKIEKMIKLIEDSRADYCSIDERYCPKGCNVEVFSVSILNKASKNCVSKYDKEHVTQWIIKNGSLIDFRDEEIKNKFSRNSSKLNFSIDTLEDYLRVSQLINNFEKNYQLSWKEVDFVENIVEYLDKNKIIP